MEAIALSADARTLTRRNRVRKLRAAGQVPAVLYGGNRQAKVLSIAEKEFELLIHRLMSENVLVKLTVRGDQVDEHLALIQEVQHHPLSGRVLHVDFHEISSERPVTIIVPIETAGEPVGVKTGGGTLEHVLFKAKVRALANDLPEVLTVDVTAMETGHTLHLGEIALPPGVEVIGDRSVPVISVSVPRVQKTAEREGQGTAEQETAG